METARHITAWLLLLTLFIGAGMLLLTGNPKFLAAGIMAALIMVFILIFTQDCEERNG